MVGARTEHIELVPALDGPAEVVLVEHLGSENFLHLLVGQQKLVTLVPPGSAGIRARERGDAASPAVLRYCGQLLVA